MKKLLLLAVLLCVIFTVAEKMITSPNIPTFTDEMNNFICIEEGF